MILVDTQLAIEFYNYVASKHDGMTMSDAIDATDSDAELLQQMWTDFCRERLRDRNIPYQEI